MYSHGYNYAWIVGKKCLVMSLYTNLGHHGAIGCYNVNVMVEIEQEMQIIKVKF